MRRQGILWAVLALLLATPLLAQGQKQSGGSLSVGVFVLKYRRVEDAIRVLSPLLERTGSITVQPGAQTITVAAPVSDLERVSQLLKEFDVPLRQYRVDVRVFRASAGAPAGHPPGPSPLVPEEMKKTLHVGELLNDTTLVDSARWQGVEGAEFSSTLGRIYRLKFRLEPGGGQEVRFRDLSLARLRRRGKKTEDWEPLISTTMTLRLDQTTVVGASSAEASKTALILVFRVAETAAAPGPQPSGAESASKTPERK
jgi:Bacterial type II/III secretion system short domain